MIDSPEESRRRTRRTRRAAAAAMVLLLLAAAAFVLLVVVPDGRPSVTPGSTLGASRGERLVGTLTDGQGAAIAIDVVATADGRVVGTLRQGPGGRAEVVVDAGGRVLTRGNREWYDVRQPGSTVPADRWVADPPGAERLAQLRQLVPQAVARQVAATEADGASSGGEQVVDGRPGVVRTDGERTVTVGADDPGRVLAVRMPLAPGSSMQLPGPDADAGASTIDVRVLEPTDAELDDVDRRADSARQQAVPAPEPRDAEPVGSAPDADPGVDPGVDPGTGTGAGPGRAPLIAEYGRIVGRPRTEPAPTAPAPGSTPGSGAALAPAPGAVAPGRDRGTGGIDLSSVELRYIGRQDTAGGPRLSYAFSGRPSAGGAVTGPGGTDAVAQASDAFFVWLTLPPDAFWVNLNPTEADRIMDPALARTDAGRVLLEADLAMKNVATRAADPRTPLGRDYWASLQADGDGNLCTQSRFWIVPGPASVVEQDGGMHILDAPLQVRVEGEIPTPAGAGGISAGGSCPFSTEAVREQNEAVERRLVVPVVEKAVNTAPQFAELRRVYLSRVAAEWYRQRGAGSGGALDGLLDRGDAAEWAAMRPWSPRAVFDRYVDAVRRPAVDVTTREVRDGRIYERRIAVGGVDWATVDLDETDPATFARRDPGRAEAVAGSFDGPVTDPEGRVWLGSSSEIPDSWRGRDVSSWALPVGAVLVAGGAVLWLRRRRRS